MASYTHLFEPIQLGRAFFQNRLFAAPQDYPGLTGDCFLTEEASYFYERKAKGGFSSVCVGDMIIDGEAGRSHPFQMRGNDTKGKMNFTRTTTAITRHGAVAAVELCHAGKNANVALMPEDKRIVYGPSAELRPDGIEVIEMNDEQIEHLIGVYTDAAAFAKQCGFGMITLHGGHGWQMSQFISPRDNRRTDKWGGTTESRMMFPLAVIESIRKRIGYAIPIEFRMSVSECLEDGYGLEEGLNIARILDGKVDLINASVGHHEIDASSMITMPSMFLPDGCNANYAMELKKVIKTPVSTVGAFTNPEMMEEMIASGKADIIELGRQTLADPDLPIKTRVGKEKEVNPCLRCFNCFSSSTVGGVFYCASNPEIGRELASMAEPEAKFKKKVLVVGGGVGGMQAALTALDRGHEVILCEKSERLGGTLLCEENIPFKANLGIYLERQAQKVENSTIQVYKNMQVTPEVAKNFAPDVIIAALGARPLIPNLDGIDRDNVLGAEEVYYHPERVGKRTVILGGGLVGLELGLYLAQKQHEVLIVEMAPGTIASPPPVTGTSNRMSGVMEIPVGYPLVHGIAIKEEMKKYPNMTICVSTKALKVTDEGLLIEDNDGTRMIEIDTVIYAIGQKPLMQESVSLSTCAPEFYQIGDCVTPKNIYAATSNAYQTAMDIGRF